MKRHNDFLLFLTYLDPSCFRTSITCTNDLQDINMIQENVFQPSLKPMLEMLKEYIREVAMVSIRYHVNI
jgi:hypothetical protein